MLGNTCHDLTLPHSGCGKYSCTEQSISDTGITFCCLPPVSCVAAPTVVVATVGGGSGRAVGRRVVRAVVGTGYPVVV